MHAFASSFLRFVVLTLGNILPILMEKGLVESAAI